MELNRKTLLNFVLGICATLFVMFIYRTILLEKTTPYSININTSDSLEKVKIESFIRDLEKSENVVEKLSSTNKRIDDILIFGGIIITLLLAINVGVYVKAESEVNKHFRDNFDPIKTEMEQKLKDINTISQKARTELDLIVKMKNTADNSTNSQTPS